MVPLIHTLNKMISEIKTQYFQNQNNNNSLKADIESGFVICNGRCNLKL